MSVNVVYSSSPYSLSIRTRNVQAKPYKAPLGYHMREHIGWGYQSYWGVDGGPNGPTGGLADSWAPENDWGAQLVLEDLTSKALENFKDKLGDSASWGETFGQADTSWRGAVDRIDQFGHFVQHVRHGRFGLAARTLRTPIPSNVSNRKAFSQNFLEYHLGWEPLVKDIYSSINFAQKPIPPSKVKARASTVNAYTVNLVNDHDEFLNFARNRHSTRVQFNLLVQAEVAVNNPNLWLLNRMGVVNPALIAWQLVPYSFVVDWFINLEQVISSYTDYYGLTMQNAFRTLFYRGDKQEYISRAYGGSLGNPPHSGSTSTRNVEGCGMWRDTGLPVPSLHVRGFNGLSPMRGATAMGLVFSGMGR